MSIQTKKNEHDFCIIFGAAVKEDGTPSGTLQRRVQAAIDFHSRHPDVVFIPSGAKGRHGPAEAMVMLKLLQEAGIGEDYITLDDKALDTFDTVVNAANIIGPPKDQQILYVCSSGYHIPRCKMLFSLLGYQVDSTPIRNDIPFLGFRKWLYYCFRELVALCWDGYLMCLRRKIITRKIQHS